LPAALHKSFVLTRNEPAAFGQRARLGETYRPCAAGGVVQSTTFTLISFWNGLTADTFFSVPSAVKVNGRTVSGYVTMQCRSGSSVVTDEDPELLIFVAYQYGRNCHLLPRATDLDSYGRTPSLGQLIDRANNLPAVP
jgi:hypothetical protein